MSGTEEDSLEISSEFYSPIQEKALQLAEKHHVKDFSASNGWIEEKSSPKESVWRNVVKDSQPD